MVNRYASLLLPLAALALGGCQLFAPNLAHQAGATQAAPDMSSYFDQRLADGRRHLQAGRLASAATAYRQASYSPAHRAEAYNGLAIAYDGLGRADLAEEYFTAAIAAAPQDARFTRNFARFEAGRSAASATPADFREAAEQATELAALDTVPPVRPESSANTPAPAASRAQRNEGGAGFTEWRPGVVHIGARLAGPAGGLAGNGARAPRIHATGTLNTALPAAAALYPQRVELSSPADAGQQAARAAYPQRVQFTAPPGDEQAPQPRARRVWVDRREPEGYPVRVAIGG